MSQGPKDSPEVVEFMALFARLKGCCGDNSKTLYELAGRDGAIREVCIRLADVAQDLVQSERIRRELYAAPVDPRFRDSWRDFEARFADEVERVALYKLMLDLGVFDKWPEPRKPAPTGSPKIEERWTRADNSGLVASDAIDRLVEFAQESLDPDVHDEEFCEEIECGANTWNKLKVALGDDIRGILRRRSLIPFVLVPRHVSARYGKSGEASLFESLRQAHDAFIFGAPFAALALMRSIMEAVLRDHSGARGRNLEALINDAQERLPREVPAVALHKLRELANAVLHSDAEETKRFPMNDPAQGEKEIVSLLMVLRSLIESIEE